MAVREGKKATAARQLRGKSSKSNNFSKAQASASQTANTDQESSGTHSNQHLGQHLLLANSAQPGAPCASGHADLLSLLPSRRARVLRIVGDAASANGCGAKTAVACKSKCAEIKRQTPPTLKNAVATQEMHLTPPCNTHAL